MELPSDKLHHPLRNSPYAERCFTILLHGGASWFVHRSILQKSQVLVCLCDQAKDNTLDLRHVSEDTAHTLVHYLYTGDYQILEPKEVSANEQAIVEFKSSLGVYAASRAFALPALETAAKTSIERLGKNVPAPDRLGAAMEAYPDPGEDDTWFSDYVKGCISALLQDLPATLRYGSLVFLDQMPTFAKIIVKSALEIASENTTHLGPLGPLNNRHEEIKGSGFISTPPRICGSQQESDSDNSEEVVLDSYEGPTQVETVEVAMAENTPVGIEIIDEAASGTPYYSPNQPTSNPHSPAAMGEPTISVDNMDPAIAKESDPLKDTYSPTPSDIEALEELFAQHELANAAPSPATQARDSAEPLGVSPTWTGVTRSPSPGPVQSRSGVFAPRGLTEPGENAGPTSLERCLSMIWPAFPPGLKNAPFGIGWEVLRVLLHCSVDPSSFTVRYDESWQDQDRCWEVLKSHPLLNGILLPEKSDAQAWQDCIRGDYTTGHTAVVFVAEVQISQPRTGTTSMKLILHRLKREKSCRFYRRFGSDRFLQLLLPSIHSWKLPSTQKPDAEKTVLRWLTNACHSVAGRRWAVFWTKGGKQHGKGERSQEQVFVNKIHFFAEDGQGFAEAGAASSSPPPKSELLTSRTKCRRDVMLDWLLQLRGNLSELGLKLYSRISLGLSQTTPTVVLREDEIIRFPPDCESSIKEEMKDGIGLISPGLMRKVQIILGLKAMPCAIQARIGSAKGMWIIAHGKRDEYSKDWIEVYPSQAKWACNWADEDHRTLEVKGWAAELKPANLNKQLLSILDDRSADKQNLRKAIKERLAEELDRDLEYMKSALQDPAQLKKWLYEISGRHSNRAARDLPFLGGLPDFDADLLSFLVDGGFDPMRQTYLSDLVHKLQMKKCERLMTDLKIKIARSTSAYMVVDFDGVLEPDQVHICFSVPFGSEGESDLDGLEVLVARNPAHLPSDIQKVRAVFKPELRHLKDVVVFSSKGDVPLAKKLSGGDYDGDRAWVCWDPDIVSGFQNTTVKPAEDLTSFFDWNEKTVEDLMSRINAEGICLDDMIEEGLAFGLKRSLLGICTKYKDDFCYKRNCIGDKPSLRLSWLLAELVDEVKKGAVFTDAHWTRFRTEMIGPAGEEKNGSINDDLRSAAKSAVSGALTELHRFMVKDRTTPNEMVYPFDPDVADYWNQLENLFITHPGDPISRSASWLPALRRGLEDDLEACLDEWERFLPRGKDYRIHVWHVYERWRNIKPRIACEDAQLASLVSAMVLHPGFLAPELSHWELLKASMTFKLYHKRSPKFLWRVAGRQLQFIKALGSASSARRCRVCCQCIDGKGTGCSRLPIPVISYVYVALKPDSKYIGKLGAGRQGVGWDYVETDDDD